MTTNFNAFSTAMTTSKVIVDDDSGKEHPFDPRSETVLFDPPAKHLHILFCEANKNAFTTYEKIFKAMTKGCKHYRHAKFRNCTFKGVTSDNVAPCAYEVCPLLYIKN